MRIYEPGESIEGKQINGNSRDPLRMQRSITKNGVRYYIFKAEFDVYAKIDIALSDEALLIDPNAFVSVGDELCCDTAAIISLAKKHRSEHLTNFSATHGTNAWMFKDRTNVKVTTPKQSIINALQRRTGNSKQLIV